MILKMPKKKEDIVKSVRDLLDRGISNRAPLAVEWYINHWYLQGARSFHVVNISTGRVDWTFETSTGGLKFRYEDVLQQYQRMLGLMMRMDITPLCKPRGIMALDDIRKASCANVLVRHAVSGMPLEQIKMDLAEGLLQYGTMGLVEWTSGNVLTSGTALIETVPPWQLLPLPTDPTNRAEAYGVIRHRWVPLSHYRDSHPNMKVPKDDTPELKARWIPRASRISNDGDVGQDDAVTRGTSSEDRGIGSVASSKQHDDDVAFVELIELWQADDGRHLDQHIVQLGDYLCHEASYSDLAQKDKPQIPISVARGLHTNHWFGRAWLSMMIPLNNEVERMLGQLFKNVQKADQLPLTLIPATWNVTKEQLSPKNDPRIAYFEVDYTAQQIGPAVINPINSGDVPGKVAATAIQLSDRLGSNSDLFRGDAPGRVEGSPGLGLLYETSMIPLIPISASIAEAFIQVYRRLLGDIKNLPGMDIGGVPISVIDDNLAGIVVDRETGQLSLDKNPIPGPDEVVIDIKSREPSLREKRRQELLTLVKMGPDFCDPEAFHWINYIEDLQLPTWRPDIVEQIKTCMYRNIIQWNDGVTSRGVVPMPTDNHLLHIRVLMNFMSRVSFQGASSSVRDEFYKRMATHKASLGMLPDGVAAPEDAAMRAEQAAGAWGGAAVPGQIPPQLQQMLAQAQQEGQSSAPPPQGAGM